MTTARAANIRFPAARLNRLEIAMRPILRAFAFLLMSAPVGRQEL